MLHGIGLWEGSKIMIRKLRLENIKAYTFGEITFQDGVTAIAGENGAGKSTIIEAIGFALFGSQRVKQDMLIRHHAKSGRIEITFTAPRDQQTYMVERVLNRGNVASTATLYVVGANGARPKVQGVREVQAEINDLLALPTAIKPATLWEGIVAVPQGQLTTDFALTPAPRKARFEDLLGLQEYEEVYKKLSKPLQEGKIEATDLMIAVREASAKLERVPILDARLKEIAALVSEAEREQGETEAELSRALADLEVFEAKKAALVPASQAVAQSRSALELAARETQIAKANLAEQRKYFAQAEATRQAYEQYIDIQESIAADEAQLEQMPEIASALAERRGVVERYRDRLRTLEERLQQIVAAEKIVAEDAAIANALEERRDELVRWQRHQASLQGQLAETKRRLNDLRGGGDWTECPVCHRPMSAELRAQAVQEYEAAIAELGAEIEAIDLDQYKSLVRQAEAAATRVQAAAPLIPERGEIEAAIDKGKIAIEAVEAEIVALDADAKKLNALAASIKERKDKLTPLDAGRQQYLYATSYLSDHPTKPLEDAIVEAEQKETLARETVDRLVKEELEAKAAYDEQAHSLKALEIRGLEARAATIKATLSGYERQMDEIRSEQDDLRDVAALRDELQSKLDSLEGDIKRLDLLRTYVRDLGPQIAEMMRLRVSQRATELYRQLSGDAVTLTWTKDYGIILGRTEGDIDFTQLSGGEQMSAALSVRLALLNEISEMRMAVFDEPTTNLDERRRTELAEQLAAFQGLRQLLVVSHDDTFEASTENVIRVCKIDGESIINKDTL